MGVLPQGGGLGQLSAAHRKREPAGSSARSPHRPTPRPGPQDPGKQKEMTPPMKTQGTETKSKKALRVEGSSRAKGRVKATPARRHFQTDLPAPRNRSRPPSSCILDPTQTRSRTHLPRAPQTLTASGAADTDQVPHSLGLQGRSRRPLTLREALTEGALPRLARTPRQRLPIAVRLPGIGPAATPACRPRGTVALPVPEGTRDTCSAAIPYTCEAP